jgi:hypothetical protein
MSGQSLVYLLEAGAVLFVVWFVIRFVLAIIRPRSDQPLEPADDEMVGVTAPRKRGPYSRTGAVALSPPDDDEDRSIPPVRM